MGTWTPFTAVGEVVAGESKKARDHLESLIKNAHKNTFAIGRQLHTIKVKGYYDGYTTFTEYLNTLDFKLRKAQYLRRIAEVMEILGIPPETYEPVGLSKLREICSLSLDKIWINPETEEEIPMGLIIAGFMDRAISMSVDEVKAYVRILKGLTPDDEMVGRHFYVTKQVDEEVVKPAIEMAKRHIGSVGRDDEGMAKDPSDGRALEVVCVEFLNDPANSFLSQKAVEKARELDMDTEWTKYWRDTVD